MSSGRTLLLKLGGPMQSWGTQSRFGDRSTDELPSFSAVLGLLASAQGRAREDRIDDLCQLQFGVRLDRPGLLRQDFQTASYNGASWKSGAQLSWPFQQPREETTISKRGYLHDAEAVVALRGDPAFVRELEWALQHPARPLYLGRRSCPLASAPLLAAWDDREALDLGMLLSPDHCASASPLLRALLLAPIAQLAPVRIELDACALMPSEIPDLAERRLRWDLPAAPFSRRTFVSREAWSWMATPWSQAPSPERRRLVFRQGFRSLGLRRLGGAA